MPQLGCSPLINLGTISWSRILVGFQGFGKVASAARKTASILVIAVDDGVTAEEYTRRLFRCDAKQCLVRVKSWPDLAVRLREYDQIATLIMFMHGIPAGLGIHGDFRSLRRVAKRFMGSTTRVTKELPLEACSVAEKPSGPFCSVV